MSFKKYNANPKGKKTTDCVIRAISKALNKKWEDVAEELFQLSKEMYSTQVSTDVYTKYLEKYKTISVKYDTSKGKKRYTIKDVCDMKGTYIIKTSGHLSVVKDGHLYDTWDCSKKSAYKIWKIK